MAKVPVIRLDHLGPHQIRAYRLADNRLAELAGWDEEILKLELGALIEVDFAFELTGFETGKIDLLLLDGGTPPQVKADPADALPELQATAVSRRGDLWLGGEHRILCGDARNVQHGADGQRTGPDGVHGPTLQRAHQRTCQRARQDQAPRVRDGGRRDEQGGVHRLLQEVFARIAGVSRDGTLIFTCIDGPHLHEMLNAGHAVFDEFKAVITWDKTMGGLGSLYRGQTELIPLWKKGKAPLINNIELGRHGRYRTTLWSYAGVNGFRKGRMTELASHPTVKPCALVMDAIKDGSKPNGIILDPFGGSGTTLIAAQNTKRRGFLVELDPLYVDGTIQRWERLTKGEARHAETGVSFAETARQRGQAASRVGAGETIGGGDVA